MKREGARRLSAVAAESDDELPPPLPVDSGTPADPTEEPSDAQRRPLRIGISADGQLYGAANNADAALNTAGDSTGRTLRCRTPQSLVQTPGSPQGTLLQSQSLPARSGSSSGLELTFSPTSTRLFRQHSFTAIQSPSPAAEKRGRPRTRSLMRVGVDGEAPQSSSPQDVVSLAYLRSVDRQHARTGTMSSAEPLSPLSPPRPAVHSPISGLFVPVREQKNYYLSPVTPPFMPSSRNHSFFDNIVSSSSSSDDLADSVCSQCHHAHFTADQGQQDDASGEAAPRATSPSRRKRKEHPVIENIDSDVNGSSGSHRSGRAAQAPFSPANPCCFHRDCPCGKRCSRAPSRHAERSREAKEAAFEQAKDDILKTSETYSYNLLSCGLDRTQPLFRFEEVPEWQKYNFFIKGSYRSYYTTRMTLRSLFGWHNETINVWSHLAGFLAFVVLTVVLFSTTLSTLVSTSSMTHTRFTYVFFCIGSILCMFNSAAYHLFTGHRKLKVFTLMGRLDFLGITILIVSSFIPPLYVMFHCNPNFRTLYITLICTLGVAGIVGPWTQAFHDHVWLRTTVYLGMGVTGIVPALHSLYLYPISGMSESFFTSVSFGMILMFTLYGTGVVFYVMQFPESRFPGQFDTFLSSHQLWHFFVLMAAMVHYCNVVSMYQIWKLSDGIC